VWTLACLYGLMLVIPAAQLIRIHIRCPDLGWTIQKLFLAFTLVSSFVRTAFFGVCVLFNVNNFFLDLGAGADDPAFSILSNIPRVIFFSTFTLLILFWAEILHRVQNESRSFIRKRSLFIVMNVIVYFVQIAFWVVIYFFSDFALNSRLAIAENIFFAVLSLLITFFFLWYGGQLFFLLLVCPHISK